MALDPVCRMKTGEDAAQKCEYMGNAYYFCSPGCRERFEKEPEKYLEKGKAGLVSDEGLTIAYFSMEIGIDGGMPTYSGGLGVLAGDTIRSAADLKVPMAAVTLLYRKGYFYQRLDPTGWQIEEPVEWVVEDFLEEMPKRASVTVEGRTVWIRAWKYMDIPQGNRPWDTLAEAPRNIPFRGGYIPLEPPSP
jgi:starch phosphorylase